MPGTVPQIQPTPTEVTPELATEMIQAGVVIGHKKSKTHPKMKPYIGGNRNEIELLAPEAVADSLDQAVGFLTGVVSKGGLVLLVGSGLPAKQAIMDFSEEFNYPFVTVRWLGGTLTNFKMIAARLKYFEDLKVKRERGELLKYTKREQLEFDKEIGRMTKIFSGLHALTRLPDALIIVDAEVHATAVREAKRMGIPVVALMDTDDNPQTVEYPVMASDHTKGSIEWIMNWLRNAMRKAPKPVAVQTAPAPAVKPVSATVSTGPKPHTGKNAG